MDATTARPTLLSAAKNFMRKSAGTAVLAIAPLAAVSLAPEAQAQTIFGTPGINAPTSTSGAAMTGTFPEGNRFAIGGGAPGGITTTRIGVDGNLVTTSNGSSAITTLHFFSLVDDTAIAASTYIPLAYNFTLSKQAGSIGNVGWLLKAEFTGDATGQVTLGSGTLTGGSATFTGTGSYTTTGIVAADNTKDFNVFLYLTYSTTIGDDLFVGMNSASQGITINAVAVPEPSTYAAIFGLGALGFVLVRRSRRSRDA